MVGFPGDGEVLIPVYGTRERLITALVTGNGPKGYVQEQRVEALDTTLETAEKAGKIALYITHVAARELLEVVAPDVSRAAAYPPGGPQGRLSVLRKLPDVREPIVAFTLKDLKAIVGEDKKPVPFGIETGSVDDLLGEDQKACRLERQNFMKDVAVRIDRGLRPVLAALDLSGFVLRGDAMSPGDRHEHLCLHYQFHRDGLQIRFALSDGRDVYHFGVISIEQSSELRERPDVVSKVIYHLREPWREPDVIARRLR